jgi:TRAP-type C4-dicarboxylate transport system substrate-binding protein
MLRLTLVLFISLLLLPTSQAATLKIATVAPDGTSWMKLFRQAGDRIGKATEGRVKLRFYPGGVMGNDSSVLRKIRVGQLHGGAITGGGVASIYPGADLYSLPFQFRSLEEVDRVREVMDEKLIAGIREQGFISYGLVEGGFAYLMSNQPVRTTADLRALKVWLPEGDNINAAAFQSLGVSPIPLPLTDVLTGLQTGLIDTIATSSIGAVALQWHTRVKYLTQTPLAYLYGTLIIKESALKRISEADRAVLQQELQDTIAELNRLNRQDEAGALAALQKQGIETITPSDQERNGWEQHADKTLAEMKIEERFEPGLFQQMRGLIQAYRADQAR